MSRVRVAVLLGPAGGATGRGSDRGPAVTREDSVEGVKTDAAVATAGDDRPNSQDGRDVEAEVADAADDTEDTPDDAADLADGIEKIGAVVRRSSSAVAARSNASDALQTATDGTVTAASSAGPRVQTEAVRVLVRVRPLNRREQAEQAQRVVEVRGSTVSVPTRSQQLSCTYDCVLDEACSQNDVFQQLVSGVEAVIKGINCTIFAYGQTGTGKTHTMLGCNLERELAIKRGDDTMGLGAKRDNWGIIPRAVDHLFQILASSGSTLGEGVDAAVYCSYMQIYNDKVYDLLHDRVDQKPLAIRESSNGDGSEIYVSGISEYRVSDVGDVMELLRQGARHRTVRATEYNEASSRSHAILRLSMNVEARNRGQQRTVIRRAKLNLVDLAGSEKWNTANNGVMTEARTKEQVAINKSLSALGNCIAALTDTNRAHVPYRDSALTRLLQDSLGGNTRTTVIATISPSSDAAEETASTLYFADRARQVIANVRINEVIDDAVLLARAKREIARLKRLLESADVCVCGKCECRPQEPVDPSKAGSKLSFRTDRSAPSSAKKPVPSRGVPKPVRRPTPQPDVDQQSDGIEDSKNPVANPVAEAVTEASRTTTMPAAATAQQVMNPNPTRPSLDKPTDTSATKAAVSDETMRTMRVQIKVLTAQSLELVQLLEAEEAKTAALQGDVVTLQEKLKRLEFEHQNPAADAKMTEQLKTMASQNTELCDLLEKEEQKCADLAQKLADLEAQAKAAKAKSATLQASSSVGLPAWPANSWSSSAAPPPPADPHVSFGNSVLAHYAGLSSPFAPQLPAASPNHHTSAASMMPYQPVGVPSTFSSYFNFGGTDGTSVKGLPVPGPDATDPFRTSHPAPGGSLNPYQPLASPYGGASYGTKNALSDSATEYLRQSMERMPHAYSAATRLAGVMSTPSLDRPPLGTHAAIPAQPLPYHQSQVHTSGQAPQAPAFSSAPQFVLGSNGLSAAMSKQPLVGGPSAGITYGAEPPSGMPEPMQTGPSMLPAIGGHTHGQSPAPSLIPKRAMMAPAPEPIEPPAGHHGPPITNWATDSRQKTPRGSMGQLPVIDQELAQLGSGIQSPPGSPDPTPPLYHGSHQRNERGRAQQAQPALQAAYGGASSNKAANTKSSPPRQGSTQSRKAADQASQAKRQPSQAAATGASKQARTDRAEKQGASAVAAKGPSGGVYAQAVAQPAPKRAQMSVETRNTRDLAAQALAAATNVLGSAEYFEGFT